MDQEFRRLLNMHGMAARFGDGLKSELHELLLARQQIEAGSLRLLDSPLKSSGPAHHGLSQSELNKLDNPVVGRAPLLQEPKDRADG